MKTLLTLIVVIYILPLSSAWSLPSCEGDESKWHNCQGTSHNNIGKYVGEWKDGRRHGQGIFYWDDGRVWKGEFEYGGFIGEKQKRNNTVSADNRNSSSANNLPNSSVLNEALERADVERKKREKLEQILAQLEEERKEKTTASSPIEQVMIHTT